MTQNCEECLTCQRAVLPSRGTLTGWRNGEMVCEEPHEVQEEEIQSPEPEEEQLQAPGHAGGHPDGKQISRKGHWGPSRHQVEHE